jgi:site-specific DNA recombinase
MNDEIESNTYKKWFKKYSCEKATLLSQIETLNQNHSNKWITLQQMLPCLTQIPNIYRFANVCQKHSFTREVFKHGLIFKDCTFGTPYINPVFAHNEMILKQKGLLLIQQPSSYSEETPIRSEIGS